MNDALLLGYPIEQIISFVGVVVILVWVIMKQEKRIQLQDEELKYERRENKDTVAMLHEVQVSTLETLNRLTHVFNRGE